MKYISIKLLKIKTIKIRSRCKVKQLVEYRGKFGFSMRHGKSFNILLDQAQFSLLLTCKVKGLFRDSKILKSDNPERGWAVMQTTWTFPLEHHFTCQNDFRTFIVSSHFLGLLLCISEISLMSTQVPLTNASRKHSSHISMTYKYLSNEETRLTQCHTFLINPFSS